MIVKHRMVISEPCIDARDLSQNAPSMMQLSATKVLNKVCSKQPQIDKISLYTMDVELLCSGYRGRRA